MKGGLACAWRSGGGSCCGLRGGGVLGGGGRVGTLILMSLLQK